MGFILEIRTDKIWTLFEYTNLNINKEAFDESRGIIIIALCKIQRLSLFQKHFGEKWTLLIFFMVLYNHIEKEIELFFVQI